jgi:CBS domain containing-hemolysin-like protein
MILLYVGLGALLIFSASYFYFVKSKNPVMISDISRRVLDDLPEDIYWQRILRMTILGLALAASIFFTEITENYVPGYTWLICTLVFAGIIIVWLLAGVLWERIYRVFPTLFQTGTIQVRIAEWLFTPVYWIFEPVEVLIRKKEQKFIMEENTGSPEEKLERIDEQMYRNAIGFKEVRIRDCMIPRTEITAVSIDDDVEDLRQAFISSGHSKVVVYRESIDDVAGYCHALAMFRKPKNIGSIVTPILIVPEAMPANDLMLRFLEERKSLALVVDEFGGTSGLVSVEDIVEQVFGEIQDEYDITEDWIERKIDKNTFMLSGRHEIDYLNSQYGWELEEGEYDTLAGMLIHIHGDFPAVNDEIRSGPYHFTIISMEDTRIDLIRLSIVKDQD